MSKKSCVATESPEGAFGEWVRLNCYQFGSKKGGPAGCLLPADMKKKYFKKIAVSFMVLSYRTDVTIICLKNEKFVNGLCRKMDGRQKGMKGRKVMTIQAFDDILGIKRNK